LYLIIIINLYILIIMSAGIVNSNNSTYVIGNRPITHSPKQLSNSSKITPTLPEGLKSWAITDFERIQIQELRNKLNGKLSPRYTDVRLCRFLRAREHKLDQAEAMLLKEMKWRQEVRPDLIYQQFPQNKYYSSLVNYWPGGFHDVDKYGVPLLCERTAAVHTHSLFTQVPKDIILQFHIWTMEKNDTILSEVFERLGAPVGYIYIMDLEGLGMKHYCSSVIDALKEIQAIDDNYYPESLRKVIVVNCPSVFTLFWAIARHVMHKNTVSKFTILKKDFSKEIQIHASQESIPRYLGGNCINCPHSANQCKHGGDVKYDFHI